MEKASAEAGHNAKVSRKKAGEHRLDAVAEACAVFVAGVGQGLIEADILAGALSQHMHLLAARRRRQLIAVVLNSGHTHFSKSAVQPHAR